jgi:hypothetical protein
LHQEEGKRAEDNLQNINKALDKEFEKKSLKEIAAAPVSALQGLASWYSSPPIFRGFVCVCSGCWTPLQPTQLC